MRKEKNRYREALRSEGKGCSGQDVMVWPNPRGGSPSENELDL